MIHVSFDGEEKQGLATIMTQGMCGLRRRSDNKHMWFASVGEADGGKKTSINTRNSVAWTRSGYEQVR